MLARHRQFLVLLAALAISMFALPGAASAAMPHELTIEGGYAGPSYFPAGTLYEGQQLVERVTILNRPGGGIADVGATSLRITWDDQRATLDPARITSNGVPIVECVNQVVDVIDPMVDPYAFDVVTCTFDPDTHLVPGDEYQVDVPLVPKRGTTATDWSVRPLRTFYDVAADNDSDDTDNSSNEVDAPITDLAVADLAVAASGPASVVVPAGGTTATYTATVTNAGPGAAPSVMAYFTLPFQATYVSGTAAGAATTCAIADQNSQNAEQGLHSWGCPSTGALAAGASRTFTITVNYTPGVGEGTRKLVLPASFKIDASAGFRLQDYAIAEDMVSANDTKSVTTSLTAEPVCAAGQTGTPPNCVDLAKTFTGTKKGGSFTGGSGADKFTGGTGNETFKGGSGNDTGNGGKGNDKLFGEAGNDTLLGGLGNDTIDGGAGDDKVDGNAGNDKVTGGAGNDTARGGAGNDGVTCGAGAFTDKLFGDAGNDKLNCKDGKGGDTINGGPGTDTCVGDKKDVFVGCETITRT